MSNRNQRSIGANEFPLIGITGKKGSGKSSIARILSDEYYLDTVSFASPIKRMLEEGLGVPCNTFDTEGKEESNDKLCGKSLRYALQTLGTEWGRNLIGADIWINAAMRKVKELRNDPYGVCKGVVIDDVRFANEAAAIKRAGGTIWRVLTPSPRDIGDLHQSETESDCIQADLAVYNAHEGHKYLKAIVQYAYER